MAQKSFKQNNPALSYFTGAGSAEQKSVAQHEQPPASLTEPQQQPISAKPQVLIRQENSPARPEEHSYEEVQPPLASKERVSEAPDEVVVDLEEIFSEDYARNTRRTYPPKAPRLYETKSKRLNLLIQPSLAADIGKLATLYRISSNELIVRVLKEYTDKRKAELKKYDRIFSHEE